MDEQTRQQLHDIGMDVYDEGVYESKESQWAAFSLAMRIVGPAVLIAFFAFIGRFIPWSWEDGTTDRPEFVLMGLACATVALVMMVFCVVSLIGWVSHRFCWHTTVPVSRMVLAISLIFDATLLIWTGLLLAQSR